MRLDGKVALITGGARGMGESHARKFVSEGAKVVITDILEDEGKQLQTELGDSVKFIRHDVTKSEDWAHVIAETEATFGPINVLVNNAGIGPVVDFEKMTEEFYRKVVDINQVSVFLGMKHVIPSMCKAKGGSIVNISSVAAFVASEGQMAYSASKWAVRGMTKVAALELAKYNIRVNSVHPGMVLTPMTENAPKDWAKKIINGIPMKRLARAEEITNMVLFLASDESSYSTGVEFIADGGDVAGA